MATFLHEFLVFLLLLLPLPSMVTAVNYFRFNTCDKTRNYTANTTFNTNLQLIFEALPTNTSSNNGFFNETKGVGSDRVYGLGLCRGDTSTETCLSCLNSSVYQIKYRCPNNKAAIIWFDKCELRYSDENFFGEIGKYEGGLFNLNNNTNTTLMKQLLNSDTTTTMLDELIDRAAFGPKQLPTLPAMFATNQTSYVDNITLYVLVQCTRDLSNRNCRTCLENLMKYLPTTHAGGRVLSGSCNVRFESDVFYDLSEVSLAPSQLLHVTGKKKNSTTIIVVAILVPIGVLLILFVFFKCWCMKRKKAAGRRQPFHSMHILSEEPLRFDLSVIKFLTDNFSESNKIGKGGFGAVYMGTLVDGREVAVKRLSSSSNQNVEQFKNEISVLLKLQHKNLVKILGYCMEEDEKLIVYEFVKNKSLDIFLQDPNKKQQLGWGKRYNIIQGIAKGLLYLHEESQVKIVHRDMKASNVLLDSNFNPKIADFGFARMFNVDQTRGITNRIAGTFGYMPPEYVMRGHFSSKSDVFSFGVLVLEIVTGRMNSTSDESIDLQTYVWNHWCQRSISNIVDPTIGRSYPMNEALRCIEVGLLCLQESPDDRISMSDVLVLLNSYSVSFNAPSPPAFLIRNTEVRSIDEENCTSHENARNHILQDEDQNELSITELGTR